MENKTRINRKLTAKKTKNQQLMLNIACGSRTHPDWNNADFSPITFFVKNFWLTRILKEINLISESRFNRIKSIDPQVIHHNFLNGIPSEDNIFDVIYHSHFLEHLDRSRAKFFLEESYRCLKKGGILRTVVPDLTKLIDDYNYTYALMSEDKNANISNHQESVYNLFHQMVDLRLSGPIQQGAFLGRLEEVLRGNALNAGEAHLWMYDKYTLESLLAETGFTKIEFHSPESSNILNWNSFQLDVNIDGSIYKENSLYVEAHR